MSEGEPEPGGQPEQQGLRLPSEPSPMARRLFWHVFSLVDVELSLPDVHQPFEKPGAHLFWVTSGSGTLKLPTGTFPLKSGPYAWFVDMKKPRTYMPPPEGHLAISGIRFGGSALDSWHEVLGGNHNPEFTFRTQAFLRRSYQRLEQLVRDRPDEWEWKIHKILQDLMGELLAARGLLSTHTPEIPSAITRVLNAVAADPTRYWRARDLPSVAHVSYSKLRTLFYQTRGETLHQYLQKFRLDQARRLLTDERLAIKEVAERLHYPNEFYFSRSFHRCTGMSPSQFRLGAEVAAKKARN